MGLAAADTGEAVRVGKERNSSTDGVFPESKEFLAGFWMVDVESPKPPLRDSRRGVDAAARNSDG